LIRNYICRVVEYQFEKKDVEKCIKVDHFITKKKKQDKCTTDAQFTMYDGDFQEKAKHNVFGKW